MTTRPESLRDRVAHLVANWVLNHIASREYCRRLTATYLAGTALWRHPDVAEQLRARIELKNRR